MKQYKNIEDHICIQTVPKHWTGYDNPQITVKVKGDMEEWKQKSLQTEIGAAILRWATLTKTPLKAEIKP